MIMDPRRQDWLNRVYRRSHSYNSMHAVEMALRAFDRKTGEPTEAIILKVKSSQLDVYETLDKSSPHSTNQKAAQAQ